MATQDDYSRYTIRVPQELYGIIEEAAKAANRSVNAEIIQRLEGSVESESDGTIKVKLPEDVLGSVVIQSIAHEQTVATYIAEAVKRQVGNAPEYQSASQRISSLIDELNAMEQDLRDVVAAREGWKTLYEQTQNVSKLFANLLDNSLNKILAHEDTIPQDLAYYARQTRSALQTSLTDLLSQIENSSEKK